MRIFTLILTIVALSKQDSDEKDNTGFYVSIKNFIFSPVHTENATFSGPASLSFCIGRHIESPSLENNDCRFLNENKDFNISSAISFREETDTIWPSGIVQITFTVKALTKEGNWLKFSASTLAPFDHNSNIVLQEKTEFFEMEGEIIGDCLDESLRPYCGIPLDDETEAALPSTFDSPVFGIIVAAVLIVLILIVLVIKVLVPAIRKRSREHAAAKRQNL